MEMRFIRNGWKFEARRQTRSLYPCQSLFLKPHLMAPRSTFLRKYFSLRLHPGRFRNIFGPFRHMFWPFRMIFGPFRTILAPCFLFFGSICGSPINVHQPKCMLKIWIIGFNRWLSRIDDSVVVDCHRLIRIGGGIGDRKSPLVRLKILGRCAGDL